MKIYKFLDFSQGEFAWIKNVLVRIALRKLIGEPSPGTDEGAHVSVSKYYSRALLPGTSEVSVPVTTPRNVAVKETESSIFCNAFPSLCCDNTQTLCNRFYGTSLQPYSYIIIHLVNYPFNIIHEIKEDTLKYEPSRWIFHFQR